MDPTRAQRSDVPPPGPAGPRAGSPPRGRERSAGGGRPWRAAALAAALLAALAALAVLLLRGARDEPPEPPPAVTILQDDAVLLHADDAEVARALDDLRALGVDWVRVTAGWSVIAPEPASARRPPHDARDPAAYPPGAWAQLDRLARLASERGLALAIDVAFWAPRWAVARASRPPERQRHGIDPGAYADFAEAVARRYPGARAFTVWNEPNFKSFLLPQWRRGERGAWLPASPHAYRAMLAAAVPRIRRHAPGALVLIGGTAPVGSARPDSPDDGVPPLRFVRELACVDERLRPLRRRECDGFAPLPGDGFAHHPLPFGVPPWRRHGGGDDVRVADLGRLVALLRRLHERGRTERELPVYVTEHGYQTDPPDPTQSTSPAEQAAWLPEAERIALSEPGVASWAQFLLRDLGERPGRRLAERWRDSQMGLRFADGRAKPAERAFALALSATRRPDGRVAVWARVRPGDGAREARIAVRGPRGWEPVGGTRRTDGRGILTATLDVERSAELRLEARSGGRWAAGPAVAPR